MCSFLLALIFIISFVYLLLPVKVFADNLVQIKKQINIKVDPIGTKDLKTEVASNFIVVKPNNQYYKEIGIAKSLGVAKGRGNKLRPGDYLTRQDMFVLTKRALEIAQEPLSKADTEVITKFADANKVSDYAKNSTAILIANV
ncbi:hypothetical protein ELD05_11480 [Caldicellulosiruptor changbaiensis]|uniref:SLH domain-containing protein n=1 Tax=Caldicellulosiruptor changbaiensis TaxID=1222016 RepID=A0A3T0D7Q5_9FIRM|nr:S-layer homology domain-containing protein [Caldicellulosiruptor changbaiensis]AZT91201.1 hypothetical protein ELD05_11480 [Caldicellulosiruptor changbaiensis]